jgi:hypothetical protein
VSARTQCLPQSMARPLISTGATVGAQGRCATVGRAAPPPPFQRSVTGSLPQCAPAIFTLPRKLTCWCLGPQKVQHLLLPCPLPHLPLPPFPLPPHSYVAHCPVPPCPLPPSPLPPWLVPCCLVPYHLVPCHLTPVTHRPLPPHSCDTPPSVTSLLCDTPPSTALLGRGQAAGPSAAGALGGCR